MDELTDKLYSLEGDAIMTAVDLVKRFKTKSSYIEEEKGIRLLLITQSEYLGEFHFDLYTLSPDAVHALWDLTNTQ